MSQKNSQQPQTFVTTASFSELLDFIPPERRREFLARCVAIVNEEGGIVVRPVPAPADDFHFIASPACKLVH